MNHFARFSERSIAVAVNLVTVGVAAVFLTGPILGLKFARDPTAKLVMISFFMTAFALSIGLITTAKRAEIFAATAAYVLHRTFHFKFTTWQMYIYGLR